MLKETNLETQHNTHHMQSSKRRPLADADMHAKMELPLADVAKIQESNN